VTGYLDSAARNLGATEQVEHDQRYIMAEEYLRVEYKLWNSSWRDDAVVLDKKRGVYTEPDRVRKINHDASTIRFLGRTSASPVLSAHLCCYRLERPKRVRLSQPSTLKLSSSPATPQLS